MRHSSRPNQPARGNRHDNCMMEEKVRNAVVSDPRGVRRAWADGLFDAICLSVYALAGRDGLSDEDRVAIVVAALKTWPDHAITTIVDRVMLVEDAARVHLGTLKSMLTLRDSNTRQADALLQPALFATSIRSIADHELARLADAVRATGVDPCCLGLPATGEGRLGA